MGKIIAICTSQKKGTAKKAVGQANIIENHGIEGDAHAGNWHRQVSLLSWQAIEAFKARGALVANGCFGENLIVDGIDFALCRWGPASRAMTCCWKFRRSARNVTAIARYSTPWANASCPPRASLPRCCTAALCARAT